MWWEVEFKPSDDGFGHFRSIWNDAFFYYFFFITMSIITLPLTCSRLQNIICNYHDKKWGKRAGAGETRNTCKTLAQEIWKWFQQIEILTVWQPKFIQSWQKRVKEGSERYAGNLRSGSIFVSLCKQHSGGKAGLHKRELTTYENC